MAVTLAAIHVHTISQPLKQPFETRLQRVAEREALIVSVCDGEDLTGYGECTAFSAPWYTEETIKSCQDILTDQIIPLLSGQTFESPAAVYPALSAIKGNRMAKAAAETAVWDLFAKKAGIPLHRLIGGTRTAIPAGTVVAAAPAVLESRVAEAAAQGYRRIKLKISDGSDPDRLKKLCADHPAIQFFADANGAFTASTAGVLAGFDACGFALIEQPFGEDDWELHRQASEGMATPICLDESLRSYADAERLVLEKAGTVAALKMSRLGGWRETLRVYDLLKNEGIGMWVGGMIEFGVSKAHNLALASLPGIAFTGDFSASAHYWRRDIITPEITVEAGTIALSGRPGIGYEVRIPAI